MEVRFPPGSRYPYEAPFVYLKTTCHDIPHELRLRYARHLYREAREICRDGIPCVYSICDLLQSNEQLAGRLDTAAFPRPSARSSTTSPRALARTRMARASRP